jgi:histidine ammonia-lyase
MADESLMNPIHINGNDLSLENFSQVVLQRRAVLLESNARQAVERARAVVDELVVNDRLAYAITTGVGQL